MAKNSKYGENRVNSKNKQIKIGIDLIKADLLLIKLDLKDRKILYELDVNSRQSNSEIAKKVGLSKQVVGFRIKRLINQGLISSFYTVIDTSKLGFTIHKNFLKLQNMDENKEKELIVWMKSHQDIVWSCSCDGKFDMAFGTWAKDIAHLNSTLNDLNAKFGNHIIERQIATIIKGEYFYRDYLTEKKGDVRKSFFGSTPSPVKIDEEDWKILKTLSTDSRMSSVHLSEKIRISPDAIAKRIKKLENIGVIKQYNIVPNEKKWPYLHHKILISFRNIAEKDKLRLKEFCRQHSNIVYIVDALGPWEFEIDTETENFEAFRRFLMELKSRFAEIIRDYSVLSIYQVHKYNFCPSVQYPNIKHGQY